MAPPTILAHKSAFLTVQTLHLSQSLAPSTAWRNRAHNDHNNDAEGASNTNSIPQRAIDDALFRLNQNLQQHVRRVYPPQATRQVAEQIDSLFLGVGEDDGGDDARDGDEERALAELDELREGIDLTADEAICSLPATWDSHRPEQAEADPADAQQYETLQDRLQTLSAQRAETKARVERLRQMQALLRPFETNVQENLVTRNGEIEKELERMRVLLVRVAGRIGQLPDKESDGDEVMEDLDVLERKKVDTLLSGL
ncbi:hypothetical protein PFICI_02682 [Pestalotiopsis fici W106-1]|uniref:Kinetochore protein fta4 n=1 Tax=Pestalotiopsis fici (strain W106-1 / CGMCC3.15140) TaxID=1229662 RepID=W3XGT8_PESFW|nr:uncharacterized protein PFICI_02682 [Pestalotiopsis fici W106-1]ETS84657.1 hypothetical protein PFICI_02682 [Pestalotiopsis fici W106-1]